MNKITKNMNNIKKNIESIIANIMKDTRKDYKGFTEESS
jgi:hypothetical protein